MPKNIVVNLILVFGNIHLFLVFIASSFFMVLLLLSLINEHILFNLNITHDDKPVIWYMGILGSLIAVGKNINAERKQGANEESFNKLSNKIKYIP